MMSTAQKWLAADPDEIGMVILSAVVTYAAILALTRWVGLRSLSKMSAADFVMTVAVGSLFASTIASPNPSLLLGLAAMACLYAGQWALAVVRKKSSIATKLLDNQPLLLMSRGEFLDDHLQMANVTRSDIYGKLREANAMDVQKVVAVVFESTGDVSVLHGDGNASPELFRDVRGGHRI